MQKGFGLIGILIVVGIIAGIGAFVFTSVSPNQNPFTPSEEEKSAIDMAEEVRDEMEEKNDDTMMSGDTMEDKTADWKTYRNEEYGFEFRYPSDFFLKEEREHQDDALNPAEDYTMVVFITNYPKETVRGPLANFNLTINFFSQAPESFASVVGLPLQTIILGTEVYKFVEYDEGLNYYGGAGFQAKYFLATPLVKDTWITFDHLPINEGDGGDVVAVKSTGNFLDYLQQKKIVRTILSTLKFIQ